MGQFNPFIKSNNNDNLKVVIDSSLSSTSENPVQNKTLNAIINGNGNDSIHYKIMTEIASVVANAPEDLNTLKEIADWIDTHEDDAAAMNTAIQENKRALQNLVGKNVTGIEYTVDGSTISAGTGAEIFNDYSKNKATGDYSHAEGRGTTASGHNSHAEGSYTIALGDNSHAEGRETRALGNNSTSSQSQHVQGEYNIEDTHGKYAFIIGNGTSNSNRSNAFAIDWNGLIYQNNAASGVDLSKMKTFWLGTQEEYDKLTSTNEYNFYCIYEEED